MQLIRSAHAPNTPSRQPSETFTGKVHMDPIFKADANSASPLHCMANNVCFTPGARTFWHCHEHGQILTVTMGMGLVCSRGQSPQVLCVGDVVHVPAGEMHWHGASRDTVMAHTAISLGKTSWFEEVEEKDYEEAHEAK
jgi:quercetin dioxygenase-like cupin family protein